MLLRYGSFRWVVYLLFAFLLAPLVIVVISSVNSAAVLSFPPEGLSLNWFGAILEDDRWLKSTITSLEVAILATLGSVALAFLSALSVTWWGKWRGSGAYSLVMILPLIFPFTATGVALVLIFRDWGLLGSFVGFVLAHTVVTLPYAFRAILVSLEEFDRSYFEASQLLGANTWNSFRRVVVPLIGPGVVSAAIFSALISFDEATVSLLLVGPFISTLPVELYGQATQSPSPVVAAVATAQMAGVLIVAMLAKKFFGMKAFTQNVG